MGSTRKRDEKSSPKTAHCTEFDSVFQQRCVSDPVSERSLTLHLSQPSPEGFCEVTKGTDGSRWKACDALPPASQLLVWIQQVQRSTSLLKTKVKTESVSLGGCKQWAKKKKQRLEMMFEAVLDCAHVSPPSGNSGDYFLFSSSHATLMLTLAL